MKTLSLISLSLLLWLPASQANETSQNGTQLVLLGTAGGPSTKKNRSQPANAVVVNGDIYILDAGDGVARQLTLAGFSVADVRAIFITHNHSDHMADYGTLMLRSWMTGRRDVIQTFGPAPLTDITRAGVKMLVLSHFGGAGEPGFDQAAVWEAAVRKHYSGALIVGEDLMIID